MSSRVSRKRSAAACTDEDLLDGGVGGGLESRERRNDGLHHRPGALDTNEDDVHLRSHVRDVVKRDDVLWHDTAELRKVEKPASEGTLL